MRLMIRRHAAENPWTYAMAVQFQEQLADSLRADPELEGVALLSEFAPVVTMGRGFKPEDFKLEQSMMSAGGVSALEVDRGGRSTYHGTGQWTLFMLDRMERLVGDTKGVRRMVDRLLATSQKTCEILGKAVHQKEGAELGLWTENGKVSSVGIRVARGVVTHGVALNGFRTAESFYGIHPCGLNGASVDFLISDSLSPQEKQEKFDQMGQEMLMSASEVFECDLVFDGDFAR